MNAYELADEIVTGELIEFFEEHTQYWKKSKVIEAINMLCQQADRLVRADSRIAELEKEIQNLHMDEMVRLGQEIDAEPVAWISKYSLKDIEQTWELTSLSPFKDDYFDIPLYTTPQTKHEVNGKAVPLSDEEIKEIHEKLYENTEIVHFLEFARALEERILGK